MILLIKLSLKQQIHLVGRKFGFKNTKKRNMLPHKLGNPTHFKGLIKPPHISKCKNQFTPEVGCHRLPPQATDLSFTSKGTKRFSIRMPPVAPLSLAVAFFRRERRASLKPV